MKTISQLLAKEKQKFDSPAAEASHKITPDTERIDKDKLESVYRQVPVVFNSVNKITQTILSYDWAIEGNNAEVINDFINRIGTVGGLEHWDELLEQIIRYQLIYGEMPVELVMNKRQNRIVDLSGIDPKTVDYAKVTDTGSEKIALDEYGNPTGYVQELPFDEAVSEQVYEPPEDVSLEFHEIYIPADNIAHFKLYTVGEGFYGVGLIEPIYRSAEKSYQLQEDYGNKAHSTLFPTRAAKVGDDNHQPTPNKIQKILDKMKEAKSSTEIALPYYIDLELLEADNPESLIDFFQHFDDQVVTGMGIPKAFATGMGESVNRATLENLDRLYNLTMKDIVTRTTRTVERTIFKPILNKEGIDGGYPEMKWEIGEKTSAKSEEQPE